MTDSILICIVCNVVAKLIYFYVFSAGRPLKDKVGISPAMPVINTKNLVWSCLLDDLTNKLVFQALWKHSQTGKLAKKHFCNSSLILEPGAFSLLPEILSIGPLLASNRLGKAAGHLWPEESACLAWLDQQPLNSVIYIAFGLASQCLIKYILWNWPWGSSLLTIHFVGC